jgi:hypothetical protein
VADIRLSINGEDNASGAMNSAASGVSAIGVAAAAAGAAIAAFGVSSVKAFADAERVSVQLTRATGGLSSAFERQASVIQGQLGVSDDLVKKMQMVLFQYGEAPASIDATVRALLDYSAATGTDALAATENLTRGVESGKAVFKELGITYDKTGDQTQRLESVTKSLAAKLGGAAAADANTLAGAARAVKEQFGEIQENLGGLIAGFIQQTGVLEKLKGALLDVKNAAGWGDGASQRNNERGPLLDEQILIMKALEERKANPNWIFSQGADGAAYDPSKDTARLKEIKARLAQLDAAQRKDETALPATSTVPGRRLKSTGGGRGGGSTPDDVALDLFKEDDEQSLANWKKEISDSEAKKKKLQQDAKEIADHAEREAKRAAKANEEAAKRTEEAWKHASEQAAVSLIQNVGGALQDLAEGNKVSAKSLLSGILGTLGSLIPGFGAIGSAIGQQVGGLVGGAIDRGSGGGGSSRYASGIVNVNVSTMDGNSSREYFERTGARAILNAARTGKGAGSLLLGGT